MKIITCDKRKVKKKKVTDCFRRRSCQFDKVIFIILEHFHKTRWGASFGELIEPQR